MPPSASRLSFPDIVRYRLHSQLLSQTDCSQPADVVRRLGAVQAQDYPGAKWALGQRLQDPTTDAQIDQDFNAGKILRTHLMRPTWHFVAPEDIRWLLKLTAPRVHTANAYMYRSLELDHALLKKSNALIEKTLQGGIHLTRAELASRLKKAGIEANGLRLTYFVMYAELEGLICSGPRRGKQFTYALLEQRVPSVKVGTRQEALGELTRRYFATRGPATLHDFTVWSGLTMAEAREGIEMVKSYFVDEVIGEKTYWFDASVSPVKEKSPTAHLLPNYDEYFIGFKDRSAIGEVAARAGIQADDPSLIAHVIVLDGQVVGGWKRTIQKNAVQIERTLITGLKKAEERAVAQAAERFGEFLQLPVKLV